MRTRAKGNTFEREIATALEATGAAVRGLEAGGDLLVVSPSGSVLHVECKRQERLRLPEWLAQQERDCPPGARRMLAFRQSGGTAYAVVPLAQFVADEAGGAA